MMDIDKKYVVLDLETNGLDKKYHDLLSISIFKPDDGLMYNRFLPLEMNDNVLATHINGITKAMLKGKTPLTQTEFDDIFKRFELDKRSILTYSTFDKDVLENYLKRKRIKGFNKLTFYNIKDHVFSSRFQGIYESGNVTKDNLCRLYNIGNVTDIHSGENDCRLEWELFKKIHDKRLLVMNNSVYEFNTNYIVPVSLLYTHRKLKKYLPNIPKIYACVDEIKRIRIPKEKVDRFGSNIDGMTIENLINRMLNAEEIDSYEFLLNNKRKLKYIGELPSKQRIVPVAFNEDGTIFAINEEDKELEKEVNNSLMALKKEIEPVVEYIKELFNTDTIYSQELVVNKDANVLGKCDLSTENAILEIKTNVLKDPREISYQLYYCANGRDCYLLEIDWGYSEDRNIDFIFSKAIFKQGVGRKQNRDTSEKRFKDRYDEKYKKTKSENIEINTPSYSAKKEILHPTWENGEKLYTISDLTKILGVSRYMIQKYQRFRGLKLYKKSNRYYISESDLIQWQEKQRRRRNIIIFIMVIFFIVMIIIVAVVPFSIS